MPPNRKLIHFTTQAQSSMMELRTHEGKQYAVVPCVGIVPGVLNDDLVTMDAISSTYLAWNGRPVVINHPRDANGTFVSANDPNVIDHVGVGKLYHTDINTDRLRFEVWVDEEKAQKLGGEALAVLDMVTSGEHIEVSTGYWAELTPREGTYKGKKYHNVTTLIIPDHLAILPDSLGACSGSDGCGLNRVMEEQSMPDMTANKTMKDTFLALSTILFDEFSQEGLSMWEWSIEDIEGDYVIVNVGMDTRRRQFGVSESGTISLTGDWETVERDTKYVPRGQQAQCSCTQLDLGVQSESSPENDQPEVEEEDMPNEAPQNETVDTLAAFIAQHQTSEAEIVEAIQLRAAQRQDCIAALVQYTNMTAQAFNAMATSDLMQLRANYDGIMAQQQQAEPEPQQPMQQQPVVYAGAGMPTAQQPVPGAQGLKTFKRPAMVNPNRQKSA